MFSPELGVHLESEPLGACDPVLQTGKPDARFLPIVSIVVPCFGLTKSI